MSLRQIQQSRDAILLSQLHFQIDALCLLSYQQPKEAQRIIQNWQQHIMQQFPQATIEAKGQMDHWLIDMDMKSYTLKVTTHGMRSQKTISRNDAY